MTRRILVRVLFCNCFFLLFCVIINKLTLYKCFGREVQFKKYLHGLSDAGTRLLFKFRSGTHGLNEELGRHRGREGKKECVLCGDECESVSIHCGIVQHIQVLELNFC